MTIEDDYRIRREHLDDKSRLLLFEVGERIKNGITLKTITNSTFIIGICVICFQQCYWQVYEYLKYETKVQVTHTFPSGTLWLIPGITVCNNNRIRMVKLVEYSPGLGKKILDAGSLETDIVEPAFFTERERMERLKTLKVVIDQTVNITNILTETPVPKLLELSSVSMVKDINCNGIWGKQLNCENIRLIESYQGAACYTMFYMGAQLEALASGIAYDFNSSLLGGRRKIDSFADHEIVELFVDFEPLEQADFQRDVGGKILVHSTGHVGSIRDMAHSILPGNSYDIIIQRFMSKRLPPPYKSNCYDYKYYNSPQFTVKEGTFPSVELDKGTCIRNCIVRHTTRHCHCWPVEVPFYVGDTIVNGSDKLKMCYWGSADLQTGTIANEYINCYKRFHSVCRVKCLPGCRTEDYRVHVMSNTWPTREQFFLASNDIERAELQRQKSCCAKISIKYLEFLENRKIMYPSMTLAQLVSNIGGIMSALIGVSVITSYRYITRKVLRCKVVNNYRLPDSPTPVDKQIASQRLLRQAFKAKVTPTGLVNKQAQSTNH